MSKAVYLIASAAPPVLTIDRGISTLKDAGWTPCLILTPAAATWIDTDALADLCDGLIRIQPRLPQDSDPLPPADAILAAPVTFNTLNKWAAGISDTLALGILNEALGQDLPVTAVPCIKCTLQRHPAYGNSIQLLRDVGVYLVGTHVLGHDAEGNLAIRWDVLSELLAGSAANQ